MIRPFLTEHLARYYCRKSLFPLDNSFTPFKTKHQMKLFIFVLSIVVLSLFKPITIADDGDKKDGEILLNEIQVIGSHNSFKKAIDKELFEIIKKNDSATAASLDYSHVSLSDQLSQGLCNLEIDVYADINGGKYAHPKGLEWEGKNIESYDPEGKMKEPGFKVLHIQDIDFRSNCFLFAQCLQELKSWSNEHPSHNPIFITMNTRDEAVKKPGFVIPEKFTTQIFDKLDSEIITNLGREKLLIPDDVRGSSPSLEKAVLNKKWPTLNNCKGKFIFILDQNDEKRDLYIKGHPNLVNRVLFTNSDPGTDEAAILIRNEPIRDGSKIRDLVKKGYIVRTRADANTLEARSNDYKTFKAACESGAQIITTDYYLRSQHFLSEYKISFENGRYFRINPLFSK
jgi:hypothetical protein